MTVRVKICCISSVEELRLAVRYGASAVGLVSRMPSGPGVIPDDRIAEIAAAVPPGVASFLLTSSQSVSEIIDQQRRLRTNTIQLCDTLTDGTHQARSPSSPSSKSSTSSAMNPSPKPRPSHRMSMQSW